MKRKGIGTIGIAVIVVIMLLAFFGSGMAFTAWGILTGPKHCDDAPYEANCVCPDGFNKVSTPWVEGMIPSFVLTTHSCIDETQQAPQQSYAQQKLYELFPDCDTISCSETDMSIRYGDAGTFYLAECISRTSETNIKVWWAIYINEDGTLWDILPDYPYCISNDGTYHHG